MALLPTVVKGGSGYRCHRVGFAGKQAPPLPREQLRCRKDVHKWRKGRVEGAGHQAMANRNHVLGCTNQEPPCRDSRLLHDDPLHRGVWSAAGWSVRTEPEPGLCAVSGRNAGQGSAQPSVRSAAEHLSGELTTPRRSVKLRRLPSSGCGFADDESRPGDCASLEFAASQVPLWRELASVPRASGLGCLEVRTGTGGESCGIVAISGSDCRGGGPSSATSLSVGRCVS